MLKYLWKDLMDALKYLPFGLLAGVVFVFLLMAAYALTGKKRPAGMWAHAAFIMYVVILLCITFFSRESGSRSGVDLKLFSTWGINARNNAFVIENIILFIPYGLVCAWAFPVLRSLIPCAMTGLVTSLLIESMQLYTHRGYYQVDDILTNLLGSIIGYLIFRFLYHLKKDEADNA